MKATIERANLLKSLGHVQSVVERRNTIPILSNVLIEASADAKLILTDELIAEMLRQRKVLDIDETEFDEIEQSEGEEEDPADVTKH